MNLKQKTVSSLIWSFIDNFASLGIQFFVGIILARILSPYEFGLIGMTAIFIAVSNTFINGGFSSALIRKSNCTQTDYSTVFFFNMAAGIMLFVALFFGAPSIARLYNEPEIVSIVRVLSLTLIIGSLTIIQATILVKNLNFKLKARISVIASAVSGALAISMASNGFGVWSLVAMRLSSQTLNSLLLWVWNRWKPKLVFCIDSFNELFGFGRNLLVSGLIENIYRNANYFVVGKCFSAQELGYYTRADQFANLPSGSLTDIIGRVSYPVLSGERGDSERLKEVYRKIIRCTALITFVVMFGMAAIAESMVLVLVGEKWGPSISYLQMLCFVAVFYPLSALNLNMLKVQGRSGIFLRLEIIKKVLAFPVLILGVIYGVKIMIGGLIVVSIVSFFLNCSWSGRGIKYPAKNQLIDISSGFVLALVMAGIVYVLGFTLPFSPHHILVIQVLAGVSLTIGMSEVFQLKDYLYMRKIFLERFSRLGGG